MAVYTAIDPQRLAAWLADHGVGTPIACEGIAAGIENSNFFVTTRVGDATRDFVLTLFERLSLDELPFYLALMKHLADAGLPCPAPMPDRHGALGSMLADKPAAIVTRLPGRSVDRPDAHHCATVGRELARLHRVASGFPMAQENPRGPRWWVQAAARVRGRLDAETRALLDAEMAALAPHWEDLTADLPRGAIHADLFRDNVLFIDSEAASPVVGGLIDFYFAGDDAFVLDLAICLNDWCVDPATGAFDEARRQAFVAAYVDERPLRAAEYAALPTMLRAGALRFWLSRLDDLASPRPAQLLKPHDPRHFERILRLRRSEAVAQCGGSDVHSRRPH